MGMSFWGLLAAPLLASAEPADQGAATSQATIAMAAAEDAFSDFDAMDESAMAHASGGADTAISIGALVSNSATQNGGVSRITTDGDTGGILNNTAANNSGITTVFYNTGNGVVFQSTVNLNIFLGETSPSP